MGKTLLKIFHKHFLRTNAFQNIFNKNIFKLNYSSMPNMNSVIYTHNCSLLNTLKTKFGFTCTYKANYPIQKKCLTQNPVYQANIASNLDNGRTCLFSCSRNTIQRQISQSHQKRKISQVSQHNGTINGNITNNNIINIKKQLRIGGKSIHFVNWYKKETKLVSRSLKLLLNVESHALT